MTKAIKHQVIWVSPNGFANEGNYVHGTDAQLNELCEKFDYTRGMTSEISNHRSAVAAEKNAKRLAKRDRRDTPSHEFCNIDSAHVSEYIN